MPIKTVIVEDEPHSRDRLLSLLAPHTDFEIIGHAENGPEAVSIIDNLKPDLVFLDVQLPVFTGLDVLHKISHLPMIIFITAYDEYAIRAFEESAIDYLLKPTTSERLAASLQRARNRSLTPVNNIIGKLSPKPEGYLQRFTIKVGDEITLVPVQDVVWIRAEEKYVFVHANGRDHIVNDTLKNLETLLNPACFLRIHKSVIIHVEKIHRIKRLFNGVFRIELNDKAKTEFEVGRTYLGGVRKQLNF